MYLRFPLQQIGQGHQSTGKREWERRERERERKRRSGCRGVEEEIDLVLVFFFVNIAFSLPSARPFRKSLIDMTSHPRSLGAGQTSCTLPSRHGGYFKPSYVSLCARNLQRLRDGEASVDWEYSDRWDFSFPSFFALFRRCSLEGNGVATSVASSRSSGLNFRVDSGHLGWGWLRSRLESAVFPK